jgi:hypothetical protein
MAIGKTRASLRIFEVRAAIGRIEAKTEISAKSCGSCGFGHLARSDFN